MEPQWWADYSVWAPISFLCLLFGVIFGILIGNLQGRAEIRGRVKLACDRLEKRAWDVRVVPYQKLGKGVYSIVDVSHIKGLWEWLSTRMKHDGWVDDL